MARLDELERLNRLRESGALSLEEFEIEKAKLLAVKRSNAIPIIMVVLTVLALVVLAAFLLSRQLVADIGNVSATSSGEPIVLAPAPAPPPVPVPVMLNPPTQATPVPSDPPVPQIAASIPSNAELYDRAKRAAVASYHNQPPRIRNMLGDWAGANTLCLGRSDQLTINKWCPIRDRLAQNLQALNLCSDGLTGQTAADSGWHTCEEQDVQQ